MQKFRQMARRAVGTVAALALMLLCARAQTGGLQGRVTDESYRPLSGASVSIKELNRVTSTDDGGNYAFGNMPAGRYTVAVSYVGYAGVERRVAVGSGVETLDVGFRSAGTQDLDEVVVIGYGTMRKRDLTGSVASVGEKEFNKGVIVAADQLIQGKAAGVMAITDSGQPGGSATVRIRGNSSLRSGQGPLYVLDGIPLSGTAARPGVAGDEYGIDEGNPLAHINPNDIASIDILKDASATAIYGSRGANGVVIITTKRGSIGTPRLGVQASTGVASLFKKLDVLSADEFRRALDHWGLKRADHDYGGNADAFDAITRTAVTQNHSVDVSGGTEGGQYRVSAGYFDQQGIIGSSDMKKLTASLNSSFTFLESKKLKLDLGILATQTNEDIAQVNGPINRSTISYALKWNPTLPLRQPDGSFTYVSRSIVNPLASLAAYSDIARVNTVIANLSPSYRITDNLVYKLSYGLTQQFGRRTGRKIEGIVNTGEPNNGNAFVSSNTESNHQLAHTLSFDKEVGKGLNINALLGYEYLSYDSRNGTMAGAGFSPLGELEYYDYLGYATQSNRSISSYRSPTNELQSYFARAVLNYQDRYLFTGTIRRDGSSKFGANNRYATFPSLALAWNLHNEAFLKGNSLVSSLKLRGGWGETGNSEFPAGASRDRYTFGTQSVSQANFGNPNLKWESSATVNVGVDFGLFQDRLSGSVEYFDKKTSGPLFEQDIAFPAPSGKVWVNLPGEIRNSGVEVALNGGIVQKEDWAWDVSLNATYLKNMINDLIGFYETGGGRQRIIAGMPMNTWYLPVFEGIDPATGRNLWRALDGRVDTEANGVIPSINRHYLGNASPDYMLGFSTSLRYKRLTATANANGAFGHYIYNATRGQLNPSAFPNTNIAPSAFDTSVKESLTNPSISATRFLEKGDYVKMSNLTLSYGIGTLGGLRNFNVSLTGQNLFVLTGYTGFFPEANTTTRGNSGGIPSIGIEEIPYPPARTFLLGVNFSL